MRESLNLSEAVKRLEAGGAVLLDTDTVAGIAVSTNRPDALHILYEKKGRAENKPVAWLVSSVEDLDKYGEGVIDYARVLARSFWPGALTLIVKASSAVDSAFVAADGTIALRMPNNEACLALIDELGCAIAATSANFSGEIAPGDLSEVKSNFAEDIASLSSSEGINASSVHPDKTLRQASMVIDCLTSRPCLKRAGAIPFSEIEELLDLGLGEGTCE